MPSKSMVQMVVLIMLATSLRSESPDVGVRNQMITHVNDQPRGAAPFTFDKSSYDGNLSELPELPIGVFDSGIGGLTVLEAILSLDAYNNDNLSPGADELPDFANERFIYFGDQANMPYGNYAANGKVDYLRELILKDTVFLLGKRSFDSSTASQPRFDKPPVKAIVIACNTATAYGLDDVRQAVQAWGIPIFVVGVVESGARGVNELILPTDQPKTIAVMATVGTCASLAYPKAIDRATGIAGKRIPRVIQQGSTSLAGAIEGDPSFMENDAESQVTTIANYIRDDVKNMVETYRQSGATEPIEIIVLGCTHFPLVEDEIASAFAQLRVSSPEDDGKLPYQHLIAEQVKLINPAELVAKELYRQLATARLRITGDQRSIATEDTFYLSVPSPDVPPSAKTPNGDLTTLYKYGREPGRLHVEDTRVVPMRLKLLPESSRKLIQNRLPEVWKRIDRSNVE